MIIFICPHCNEKKKYILEETNDNDDECDCGENNNVPPEGADIQMARKISLTFVLIIVGSAMFVVIGYVIYRIYAVRKARRALSLESVAAPDSPPRKSSKMSFRMEPIYANTTASSGSSIGEEAKVFGPSTFV